jgi:hypothetical protein
MNANIYVVYIQKPVLHIHFSLTVFYVKKSVAYFCFIQLDNRLRRSSTENGLIYNYFIIENLYVVV